MTPSAALTTTEPAEIPSPVVPYVETNPVTVLLDEGLRARFFAEIEETVSTAPVDLTTDKGRKEVAALAYKISRTKTAIDDAGKALTEEWRAKTKVVNDARAIARDRLDDLRDKARAPLTKWESEEAARVATIESTIDAFDRAAIIPPTSTSADIEAKLSDVRAVIIDPDVFREFTTRALAGRQSAIDYLEAGLTRVRQDEADRAELAKLRAEREERERAERERQEAEQRARLEAEAAEARRLEVERLAAEKVAEAERKAEEARLAAARAEEQRIADVAAAEARAVEAAAQAKADVEREALARKEREEQEAAEAKAEEARRAADREHRSKIMTAAKVALMDAAMIEEDVARRVVLSITACKVPNVSMQF